MNSTNKLAQVNFGELVGDKTPLLAGENSTIGGLIGTAVRLFFPIAVFALLAMLISSGYQYMVSAGDPKSTAKAQQGITYAVVGFVIIFASWFIVNYFGTLLRITQITEMFGG
jgi:hypothetical protein